MQATLSSGATIGFEAAGYGRPLLFLHAFPLDRTMWMEQLWEFSRDCYVVTMDARGFGQSSPFDAAPSLEQIARDADALLTHLKINEPVALCGLSMGGYAAMEFARLFPARLCALILADTRADADSDEARAAREENIEFVKEKGSRALAEKMLPKLLSDGASAEAQETVLQIAAEQSPVAVAAGLQALRDRRDSTDVLRELNLPTLLLTGADDEISSPKLMAELAAQMPDARHEVIEHAGHLSNLENPAQFNRIVREFLKS